MDHGQGALRGFAKILLTSLKLRKEKEDLSYGCLIVKLFHVQCKKDTYRIIKNTAIPLLNDSINHLKESRCVIVTNKARQLVQACLVPRESTDVHINAIHDLCYNNSGQVQVQVHLFDGHALEQHKRLQGIGDKGEDFVEKGHQLGLRDERRTWNIRNFEKQQRSQLKHIRRGNQAEVKRIIESFHLGSKRNLKRLENGGDSLEESRKRAKHQEVKKERREKAPNDS
jgi:hypothetical protein